MASSRSGQAYHQDYIARIRYSNTLPPPPNPPKLLEIPGAGLSDGHYTSAAYASRLIREQPLNIEADAELGMPIDLVGLPGVFEGDESASSVSFLRRTEYVSSEQARARGEAASKDGLARSSADPRMLKRKRDEELDENNPKKLIRDIVKSFNLAYPKDAHKGPGASNQIQGAQPNTAERDAWAKPTHPSDRSLTLLDAYPITIDYAALPDYGSYIVAKFVQAPVTMSDTYDRRLDTAIFRPIAHSQEKMDKYEAMRIEHRANPSRPLPPQQTFDYEYFLPENDETAESAQTLLDTSKVDQHSDALYTAENEESGHKHFRFERIRTYEHVGKEAMPDDKFNDVVALALHDGSGGKDKAAYVYPVSSRLNLRARRGDPGNPVGAPFEGDNTCDVVEMGVRELNDEELAEIDGHKSCTSGTNFMDDMIAINELAFSLTNLGATGSSSTAKATRRALAKLKRRESWRVARETGSPACTKQSRWPYLFLCPLFYLASIILHKASTSKSTFTFRKLFPRGSRFISSRPCPSTCFLDHSNQPWPRSSKALLKTLLVTLQTCPTHRHRHPCPSSRTSQMPTSRSARRLQAELMTLMMSSTPGISAFPSSDADLLHWTATIAGPDDTPYQGMTFRLSFEFPTNYPYKAPTVLFKTPIYHPNIDFSGRICLDILKDKWSAIYNVQSVLLSLQSLLGEPNNASPLNGQAAELWDSDMDEYKRLVIARHVEPTDEDN
ncbi:hypothetical protein FH972_021974 [Carpinus fangiana]|uniref:E2 ubiquitin-conjugating enzyme 11 n=1 Tax=Carpinus fangiana TaxID=176857 RepID=A0A5N6KR87_9ROSI|nr:hypothetical protein FH972_021974 [Carpinus fangiana]